MIYEASAAVIDSSKNIYNTEIINNYSVNPEKKGSLEGPVIKGEFKIKSDKIKAALYDISILLNPEELSIFIDREFVGTTNRTLKLTEGRHEIEVMSDPVYKDIINVPAQGVITIDRKKKNNF